MRGTAVLIDGDIFRGLLEAAPDAILAVDESGIIVFANAQAEVLFGYAREELIDQPVETLVPASVRAVHPRHRKGYFESPQTRPMAAGMELAGRRKDGSEFPAEISLSAMSTAQGTLVSAAVRDVTERKRAEAKFRGLLDAAPDAVVGVDRSGHIALVNAQAERLFGYRREDMLGQTLELLIPDAARDVHPTHRQKYFNDPRPRPMGAGMQLAGRRCDGSEFPAEISLSSLDTEDGLLVSAAVRDITDRIEAQAERERLKEEADRKKLEAQLHQSQRLESLGQLAGGVAHDFNNLLAVILNYAAFIYERVGEAADSDAQWVEVRGDVEQVQRAAARAAELTHQLLAFGRREVVHPRLLVINDVIAEVESILRRTLGEHVDLVTVLAEELWSVMADAGQLEQILVNEAVNARDAMISTGGALRIDTENIVADEAYADVRPGVSAGRYVRVRITDTGPGMPPDVLDRAFDPFFTTKPKGEGSGLGLATIYGIVTQAGGHVHLYSEPGTGTTLTALFPALDTTSERLPVAPVVAPRHGQETVLVVEDEQALGEVTRRLLTRNGYTVLSASTGVQALKLVETHPGPIHLLLTDVIMPGMLGKEVAQAVTVRRPEARVLYMSGYAEPVLTSHGTLEAGIELVEKPFSESTLIERVRRVLDEPSRPESPKRAP